MDDVELPTRVGRAERGDNRFRGLAVSTDIAGRWTLARIFALAVGRHLDEDDAAVLDDLAGCCLAADPRIWPLKIVRVASSHGDVPTGLCAALLGGWGRSGPPVAREAAELLLAIDREVAAGTSVLAAVESRLRVPGARLPGFGVAHRNVDERAVAFASCLAARGRDGKAMWRLLGRIEAAARALRGTGMNVAGATAAALLDLGFSPAQMPALVYAILLPSWLANAVEGAEQAPEVLRVLPASAVVYVGPPARRSARATNASGGG